MYITCKCWIILLFLFSLIWRVNTYKAEQIIRRGPGQDPQCADPLINSADKFPDASFSSSSVWKNATDFQPFRARLTEVYGSNEHTSGYAWCPNTHVEDGLREWIQAEFSHLVIISVIFTVGRGDGNVKEYMPNFVLRYQREDNGIWYEHVKSDGTRVLKANSDPRNIARTTLDSVVIAKRIRIYPYSHRSKQQVCLRFALYGCNFPDGVTSYSMPQGDTVTYGRPLFGSLYSVPHSFQDLTYDGQLIESDNQLMGGIGQLMDNVAYLGNVTLLSDSHPTQPGFHFVGWQIPNRDLRIVFKFDEVRSFIWLRIFTFDSIPLQSRVFSRAVVEFSMDGKSFGKPVEILTSRARMVDPNQISSTKLSISDMHSSRVKRSPNSVSTLTQETIVYSNRDWDGALVVQMPLTSHTGRYVSLTLTPSDSWILLSEVQFNSTIVQPESLLANNEEVDSLTKSVGGNSNSGDSHEQNSHLDVNLFRNSPLAADPETNKQANKMNSGSEVQSPIVGNEKSSISTHDERLSGAESSSNGENYYLSSSSSAAASASASSSSSKSMSTSTTPSTQLPQIIVIVSYVLGGILSLFILLALIIIVQRRCRHHLHFKHQCCKQLAVETTGISSSNPSGGFYSPISLIGAYGNNNNPNNNNNSLMNYNVVNTMNIPEAAKLLQSIPTLSPNARTTENFVHNCLPNGSGGVGVVHHPNSLLQYAMNNSNNNNNNTSVTDSNSVIVNNNNNNNTNNTRFGGTGGVGKLDYVSSVPPPLPPANLLLPRVPQTTMYGGVSDANVNSTTTNNNDQFIAQTSLYMQTNPNRLATTLVASDLNSLGGMNNFMPSYIVLPSLTTNSGYILQPIITSTMERQYHANNCDNSNDDDDSRAQDSASLYTSIRNSLVNSNTIYSGVSGTNSEQADGCYSPILENQTLLHPYHYDENVNHTGDDSGNMVLEKERSPCVTMVDKQTNLVNSHNGEDNSTLLKDVLPISLRQQQQQQQQYGNDNSYLSKIFASGRNSSGKSKRIDSEEQTTLMRRQGDVKGQQSCGELSTKQGVTNHLVNRRKRRPLSQQISSFFLKSNNSHRSSVHSLPDSDEKLHPSNVIHSGCIKRSSIPCQNVIPPQSILQLSPRRSFLLLPYGPEYASASIFGFTPPPSDLSDGVSINCGDNNIPSNYYRPIVSRLGNYPMSGLTALNTNHNGPTSLPLTGPTYELHTTHISPNLVSSNTGTIINNTGQFHSTLNQQNPAGFLFLPRSQIGEGGFTGAGNMINRISLTANQFQQLNQNNTPFISTINGDPYNIYQAAGMNLPVQSNLQMHQHNHHQQQQQQLQLQQPVEYKLPKRTDDITWQSSLMNPESTMIHSEPQTPLTEQCLSNSETSWPGTVNNNSNNNGNNNYRTLNITEMKNGTLKNNYFLPVMNTSTTLNSNYNNNNNINDERSYFPSHQLIYPSFPPPPISGTLMITTSIASQPQQSSLQTTTITTAAATNTVTSNGPNMSSRGSPVGAAATSTGPDGGGGYTVNESTNSGPPMSFYSVCI